MSCAGPTSVHSQLFTRTLIATALVAAYLALSSVPSRPYPGTARGHAQTSLVAAWAFDEGSGATAADASGNDHNGSIAGATWTASGRFGGALSFDGNSDIVSVLDSPLLDFNNTFTLEAWVRPATTNGSRAVMFKEDTSDPAYALYAASADDNGRPTASVTTSGSGSRTAVASLRLSAGAWTHLAATFDGGTLRLYVNGDLMRTRSVSGTLRRTTRPLRIGGSAQGEFFQGIIDEVRIYGRALTAAEILDDMETPIASTPPPPPPLDTTAPQVAIASPAEGSTLTQTTVIAALASDDTSVAGVQFFIDGAAAGPEDISAPYQFAWDTRLTANGVHTLSARARDAAGNAADAAPVTVLVNNPPTLGITQPANGATLSSATVAVTYAMSGDVAEVDHVHFVLDAATLEDASVDGAFSLADVASGAHTLGGFLVRADHTKIAGSDAAPVAFTIALPDTTAPAIQITAPQRDITVHGTIVLQAAAADDRGIAGVRFLIDGVAVGAEDLSAPYEFVWNTDAVANGVHTVSARARDAAGNTADAAPIALTVSDPPSFAIAQPATGANVSTANVAVAYTTAGNLTGLDHVHFVLDASRTLEDLSVDGAFEIADLASGSHTLTGFLARADHSKIAGTDVPTVAFTVTLPDTVPPTISISAPQPASVVRGVAAVQAFASDDTGVAAVQFFLDGAALGAEDAVAPFEVTWDTTKSANGEHTLSARARDKGGNTTDAAAVTVTVNNPPLLVITAPANGASLTSSTVAVAYSTTGDLTGVDHVHFVLDATRTMMDGSFDGVFQIADVGNGAHTLTGFLVRADHTKILETDAAAISFTVTLPDTTAPTIAIAAPQAETTVRGTVTVQAIASDDVRVAGVQFLLDGVALGAEDLVAPFDLVWDTTRTANGTHLLSARARDAAGNSAVAADVVIAVGNTGGPSEAGQWSAPFALPVVAIHQALLPTGKILMWDAGDFTASPPHVWDPATGTLTPVSQSATDLFCAGHTMLPDGRLLTLGGDTQSTGLGVVDVNRFDPFTSSWTRLAPMSVKRWYPTGITLANGRVLAMSGYGECYSPTCLTGKLEMYDPGTNRWSTLPVSADHTVPSYPFLFSMPGNRVLLAGSYEGTIDTRVLDLTTNTWTIVDPIRIDAGSAVMYGPGKVMKAGKWANSDPPYVPGHANTYVLDMNGALPTWRSTAPMNFPRAYPVLTLLPDGSTLATGGSRSTDPADDSIAVLEAEIWSPDTETWTAGARMRNGRLYHGSAILLPDGRVLVAGSGRYGSPEQMNGEIYSPPYLFKGARPTIASAPSLVMPGSSFVVGTSDLDVTAVTMIRSGTMTHSFNPDQRFLKLGFRQVPGGVAVDAPADTGIAPPGYYLLFLINSKGVPSVGSFVRIPSPAEDHDAPSAPIGVVATGALGSVSLSWTPSTDNVAVTGYNVHRSTVSGFAPTAANRVAQSSLTSLLDTNVVAGTYFYRVVAVDATGNTSEPSAEVSATVTSDTQPPTAALVSPASGTTVTGTITIAANATDDVAVAGVRFLIDGVALGAEDTSAPYSAQWNTAAVSNGAHQVTVVARDGAGNASSASVDVTVSNAAPTGLIVALGFDEGTGTVASDASGRNNAGTIANATWTAGRFGGALQFNGTNSWVTIADNASLDLTTGITMSAWVRPSSLADWSTIVLKERTSGLAYALYATDGATRPPSGYINTGGGDIAAVAPSMLPLNAWTHVAVTYSGSEMRLYVNGALTVTRAVTGSAMTSTNPLRVGGNAVWGEYFAGAIDEVRVYNRALTQAEIQADMNKPVR